MSLHADTPANIAMRLDGLSWRDMIPILKEWGKAIERKAHSEGYHQGCQDTAYGWDY